MVNQDLMYVFILWTREHPACRRPTLLVLSSSSSLHAPIFPPLLPLCWTLRHLIKTASSWPHWLWQRWRISHNHEVEMALHSSQIIDELYCVAAGPGRLVLNLSDCYRGLRSPSSPLKQSLQSDVTFIESVCTSVGHLCIEHTSLSIFFSFSLWKLLHFPLPHRVLVRSEDSDGVLRGDLQDEVLFYPNQITSRELPIKHGYCCI